jgi:hypothetical protein
MEVTLDVDCFKLGGSFYPNNITQTPSIFVKLTFRKYLFRHPKGKSMVNFYIINALGQNLANSESCSILRLLQEAKICNFR